MMRTCHAMIGLTLCSLATASQAQVTTRPLPIGGSGEAIIYRDRDFSGSAVNVARARSDLGLAWQIRSVRIERGMWELCARPNFEGNCFRIDRSNANLARSQRTVQSMRPVYDNGWELIGEREVRDQTQRDTIISWGDTRHRQVRLCVVGSTVRFYDVELVYFFDGKKDVPVRSFIGDGQCTPDIDLDGARNITFVNMTYETFSIGAGQATVQVYGRQRPVAVPR